MSGVFSRSAKIIPMKGDVVIDPQSSNTSAMMQQQQNSSLLRNGRRAPGHPGESMPFVMQVEVHGEAFDASFDPIQRNETVRRVENNLRGKGIRFLMYETSTSTYVEITDSEVVRREVFFALMNRKKNPSALSSIMNNLGGMDSTLAAQLHRDRTAAALRHHQALLEQHQSSPVPTAESLLHTDAAAAKRNLQQQQNSRVARRKVDADVVDLTDDLEEQEDQRKPSAVVPPPKNNASETPYGSLMDRVEKQHKKHNDERQQGSPRTNRLPTLTPQEEEMLEVANRTRQREAKIQAMSLLRENKARQQQETFGREYEQAQQLQLSGQASGQQQQQQQQLAAADARAASELNVAGILNPAGIASHAGLALNPYSTAAALIHQQHQQQARFAGLSMPLGGVAGIAAAARNGLTAHQKAAANQVQQQLLSNTANATTHLPASHAKTYAQHFFKPLKINSLPSKSTNEMSGWQFFPMTLEKDLKNLPLLNEWRIVVTPMSGNLDRSFTVDPSNVLPASGR